METSESWTSSTGYAPTTSILMNPSSTKRKRGPESEENSGLGTCDGPHSPEMPKDLGTDETPPNKKRERDRSSEDEGSGACTDLPSISRYLPVVHCGSSWHTRDSLENIIVFGDSYSKSYETETWADHLRRQLEEQGHTAEVHNFASPGATASDDFSTQLSRFFTKFPKEVTVNSTPVLDPARSTYFIFLGINDCGSTTESDADELESIVSETIFDGIHDLYVEAGARNFVLVDVPPVDRSPQALDDDIDESEIEERVRIWNERLRIQAAEFVKSNTTAGEVTMLIFSAHRVLMDILDDPLEYDFSEDDVTSGYGGIWVDELHLTGEVHDVMAERLGKEMRLG